MNRLEQRRPAGERRSLHLVLTACLLLATGLCLLGAGATLTDARVALPNSTRTALQTAFIEALYAAVNHAVETGDPADLDALVAPDFLWCNLNMPGINGVDATRRILHASPRICMLVLPVVENDDSVFAAIRAGARGHLLKGPLKCEILRAIRAVAGGDAIFGPAIAAA